MEAITHQSLPNCVLINKFAALGDDHFSTEIALEHQQCQL